MGYAEFTVLGVLCSVVGALVGWWIGRFPRLEGVWNERINGQVNEDLREKTENLTERVRTLEDTLAKEKLAHEKTRTTLSQTSMRLAEAEGFRKRIREFVGVEHEPVPESRVPWQNFPDRDD